MLILNWKPSLPQSRERNYNHRRAPKTPKSNKGHSAILGEVRWFLFPPKANAPRAARTFHEAVGPPGLNPLPAPGSSMRTRSRWFGAPRFAHRGGSKAPRDRPPAAGDI